MQNVMFKHKYDFVVQKEFANYAKINDCHHRGF